jgi:hypothetical protein
MDLREGVCVTVYVCAFVHVSEKEKKKERKRGASEREKKREKEREKEREKGRDFPMAHWMSVFDNFLCLFPSECFCAF